MNKIVLLPVCLFTLFPGDGDRPKASPDSKIKSIIEKAIEAHGGKKKLARISSHYMKTEGPRTKSSGKNRYHMTMEHWYRHPNLMKVVLNVKGDDEIISGIHVLNGKHAWEKIDMKTRRMSETELKTFQEDAYRLWLMFSLYPLLDRSKFTLKYLGEMEQGKVLTHGIRVSAKGHNDLDLYFDKKRGYLAKTQTIELGPDGKMHKTENYLSGYTVSKDFVYPAKRVRIVDGEKVAETRIVEIRHIEKMDMSLFKKP